MWKKSTLVAPITIYNHILYSITSLNAVWIQFKYSTFSDQAIQYKGLQGWFFCPWYHNLFLFFNPNSNSKLLSVLWCCWLGGRKGIRPVTNMEWWGAGMIICLERGANDLHMVQLMPLPPRHLLLQQNPEWFILLVPAYPGCPGKKAVERLCVCVFFNPNSSLILGNQTVKWAPNITISFKLMDVAGPSMSNN